MRFLGWVGGVVCISEGFEVVGERGTRANHGELSESGWR